MFESTGWCLVEPSNEDTSKYDNICPTVVSWTPETTGIHQHPASTDPSTSIAEGFLESTKVAFAFQFDGVVHSLFLSNFF